MTVGAWTAWPKTGSVDIDPYARATIARTGALPIGVGDGVAFFARTDDAGNALDGRCTFLISGATPAARYWTVTLYDARGRLVANTIDRHGFTSAEVVRDTGRQLHHYGRAARAPWKLAAERRDRTVRAGVAALRHADRRCDAHDQGRADADHRSKGLLMIRIALWILGALLLGGIVHLSTVLAMPHGRDAGRLFAALAASRRSTPWCRSRRRPRQDATMPFMDPAFAVAVCRYDLSAGTLKLQCAAEPSLHLGDVLHAQQRGLLRDQRPRRRPARDRPRPDDAEQHAQVPEEEDVTAADRLIIESPTQSGLIVLRALAPEPSLMAMARRALAGAQCHVEESQ